MSDRITETITTALAAHEYNGRDFEGQHCAGCEWISDEESHDKHLADLILAALKAARIALIELPEVVVSNPIEGTRWFYAGEGEHEVSVRKTPAGVIIPALSCYWSGDVLPLVAALLAADAAEATDA